ncbi:hypothetical protein LEMA_P035440.1 [Plenodomus lingam JN3]|uniref:Uncharacterized protein n=1 Tax=Leptosphaeria maculans (strain JN3 / isolate v23.1.3 / race Av1-4-5-6-7-8) TaxID=985895 RepID=E4ZRM3_LEPMJ|nr:hypothetical protein LEMA_P035440.1 [Plenodomus lingam JN3]CBX93870.1 hypothetical protein LEMA_P035440.1 [Plenodomus lingam JN3]
MDEWMMLGGGSPLDACVLVLDLPTKVAFLYWDEGGFAEPGYFRI